MRPRTEPGDRAEVGMKVSGSNGAVYPVSYTLTKINPVSGNCVT